MKRLGFITALAASCVQPMVAVAQQPGVELRIDTRVLELGEAINVQLICTNIAAPSAPRVPSPAGLNVTLLNPTPSTSSFTQIVNGRTTRRSTSTFWLRIKALRVGTHTLPAITVMAGGNTYATAPVQITVRKAKTSTAPTGDRIIWAELTVEPLSVYVTQTYTASLTFGIRKVEISGRVYNLDMLRTVLDVQNSQLGVFANGRATRSERWLADSNGKRHRYEVFQVTKRVRAEEVGSTVVGPIFLRANYPTGLRRGFFGGYEVTGRRRETTRVDGILMEIKAPPLDGRPADYLGAIGRFSMTVSAKPLRVEQGQPITLTVSISGSPLKGLAGPNITRHAELASRFDFTKDELVGDTEGGRKVFHRAIFPKRSGDQTVPGIRWSYFDPQRERYVTLTSDPIAIAVDPGSGGNTAPIATDAANASGGGALTVLRAGIEANYTDTNAVLADQSLRLGPAWFVTLGMCPLAWLVVTVLTRHRTRMQADVRFARRRRARRSAHDRLSKAMNIGDPTLRADGLAAVVTGYLSDRFGLATRNLTPDEVRSLPLNNGFDRDLAEEIAEFLERCDAVRYSPSEEDGGASNDAGDRIRRWIESVEGAKP